MTDPELARLTDVTKAVLESPDPHGLLVTELSSFMTANRPDLTARLFESVAWRVSVANYWVLHIAGNAYHLLGNESMAAVLHGMSHQMGPSWSGAYTSCRIMFGYFVDQDRARDAVDLFQAYGEINPQKPFAANYQINPLLRQVDPSHPLLADQNPAMQRSRDREDRLVFEASERPAFRPPVFGKLPLVSFSDAGPASRPAITVARLRNAVVQIKDDAILVRDADGTLQTDLCVTEFPGMLGRHLDAHPSALEPVERPTAILISDYFSPTPNLSHFMLDGLTRLAIYQQAGLRTEDVTVIGGRVETEFQSSLLSLCGVGQHIGTNQEMTLRVAELWVSSNCRALRHPAHDGSPWALDYLRRTLVTQQGGGGRRLYVSRSDAASRRVVNEAEVMAVLARHGFEAVVPGSLPIAGQLALFSQASHVVGAHGAGLTNIVVCEPGTAVLEILHPLYGTAAYARVSQGRGLRYAALIGTDGQSDAPEFNQARHVDLRQNKWGLRDVRVDLSALEEWLAQV